MAIPSADTSYSFAFDGRTWACRDEVPGALWHDFDVLTRQPPRRPNRRVRKRATQFGAKVLGAVVIDVDDLLERARRDPNLFAELVEVVLPDVLNHYGMPLLAGSEAR